MPPRPNRKGEKPQKREGGQQTLVDREGVGSNNAADGERSTKRRKPNPTAPQRAPTTSSRPRRNGGRSSTPPPTVGTSYFSGARRFSIKKQQITNQVVPQKSLFERLSPHVAHGAAHDSNDRRDAPMCHKETRVAIIEDINGCIKHDEGPDETNKIVWLSGPAGAGKSAIAGSVAGACQKEGILAATFFFSSVSSSLNRRWGCSFVATLVLQMAQHRALACFKQQLLLALDGSPDIFHKHLKQQAEHLILGPFSNIHGKADQRNWPRAVIVDGVDEVVAQHDPSSAMEDVRRRSEEDQVEILDVLLSLCRSPYFPFRILVASRPEKNITDFFDEARASTIPLFLDSKYDPDADVELYLWSRLSQIRRRFRLPALWPKKCDVDRIVKMSSGQFIVPTTIIRWIESGMPQRRLDEVLDLQNGRITSKNPFQSLDVLYHHILARARNAEVVIKWIHSINTASPSTAPVRFWRQLLEDEEGELDFHMAPISSLMSIPPPSEPSARIEFYHKSFVDYLSTPSRCGNLSVSDSDVEAFVSRRILTVLKNKGPRVPPPAPQMLGEFIYHFVSLHLVHSFRSALTPISKMEATFIKHLKGEDLNTLASCDAEWWTRLYLRFGSVGSPLLRFLCGIYFGIHQALECEDLAECHEACVHWRTGILSRAKKLGWCTHQIERIGLAYLHGMTRGSAGRAFGPSADEDCRVCKPGKRGRLGKRPSWMDFN